MRKSARTQIPPFFDNDPYSDMSLSKRHLGSRGAKHLKIN